MHIEVVAPRVLLCLLGPRHAPPPRHTSSRSSAHSHEPAGTPPGSVPRSGAASSGGAGSVKTGSTAGVSQGGALGLLKTQAHGLAVYLREELKGYELPDGL